VGVERAIAVSSSNFSVAARRLAQAESIDLHDLRRLRPEDAFAWVGLRELQVDVTQISLAAPHIEYLDASEEAVAWLSRTPIDCPDDRIFFDTRAGGPVSLWQILSYESALAPPNIVTIPPDGIQRHVTTFERRFARDDMRYEVATPYGSIPIATLAVEIHLKVERTKVPLADLSLYTQAGRSAAETAEFRFELDGKTHVFALHRLRELEQLAASIRRI
jgi:hypothetical protein